MRRTAPEVLNEFYRTESIPLVMVRIVVILSGEDCPQSNNLRRRETRFFAEKQQVPHG